MELQRYCTSHDTKDEKSAPLFRLPNPPLCACVLFVDRHLPEREEQRQALEVDPDAASWRKRLGTPACAPAAQHAIRKPAADVPTAGPTTQTHSQTRDAHTWDDSSPDGGKEMAAEGYHARGDGRGKEGGASFLCSVVPLSLAIQQLGIAAVDLLKVDVEGDELAVLHGIDDDDWPKIRQVSRTRNQAKKHIALSDPGLGCDARAVA